MRPFGLRLFPRALHLVALIGAAVGIAYLISFLSVEPVVCALALAGLIGVLSCVAYDHLWVHREARQRRICGGGEPSES